MTNTRCLRIAVISLCALALLLPGLRPAQADPVNLKVTKASGSDLMLNWEGQTAPECRVQRTTHGDLSFPQTIIKTGESFYQDPFIVSSPGLFFYNIAEFDCSLPTESLVRGRILCQETGEPVAGCDVAVTVHGCGQEPVHYSVATDSNGLYEVCVTCPGCEQWTLLVEPCCAQAQDFAIVDCPAAIAVPNILCECQNDGPCDDPNQTQVSGTVVCQDNGEPMAGCNVQLEVWCPNHDAEVYTAQTDANGHYEACVQCPDCEVWTVVAMALCCDAVEDAHVTGCPGEQVMPPLHCTGCGEPGPCGENRTLVTGRVMCADNGEPMADCEVQVEVRCEGDIVATYTDTTGPNGWYEVCVDCPGTGCPTWTLVAHALCCNVATDAAVHGCPADFEMPVIHCTGCADPPPCGADSTLVTGRVMCADNGEPMAGCEVHVDVRCAGEIVSTYITTTGEEGWYEVCVDCPGAGCSDWTLVAHALCCDVAEDAAVHGCPADFEMPVMHCTGCGEPRPCGEGQTLVTGRVMCADNGEPMAGCEVRVEAYCEDLILGSYNVTTGPDGWYEACVYCPGVGCAAWRLVARALCCDAATDAAVQECPPQFQMPVMHCTGCGG
jgi:microcompartment protein CcmK/EutM